MPFQFFSPEEAEAILRRAAGSELTSDQVTEDQLVSMAAELGISPDAVRSAALQHRAAADLATTTEQYRAHLKRKIMDEVGAWAGTSVLLVVIDLFISPGYRGVPGLTWSMWPVGIWGAVVAIETSKRLYSMKVLDPEKVRRWRERRDRKALKGSGDASPNEDDE